MPGGRPYEPGEDEVLARDIAAAVPDDDIDDALGLAAFLVKMGLPAEPVLVGEFQLERRIGHGGFGTVYVARQPSLGRPVAIKVLHEHRFARADWLKREALALAQLNHPNVVQIYQVGESARGTFIAMEYVDGESLREWQTGRSWQELVAAYAQAGEGLAAAHARGILHLDFKPSNALMGRDGRVRVADFGLAGGPGIASASGSPTGEGESSARVYTRPVGGTYGYASPEQAGRGLVDAASDQFSFCVALYEALHGALPFGKDSGGPIDVARPGWPVGAHDTRAPRWVEVVVRRGLAASARDRWPSMRALLEALRRPPWYRRSRSFALLGAMIVAGPAMVAGALERDDTCSTRAQDLGLEWSRDRRREVELAIADSGAPYRDVLGPTVSNDLDRWAKSWIDSAHAVCTAAHADAPTLPEQHVRQRECLRRQSDRFESVVAMITEGGSEAIESSDALVNELEDAADCESTPGVVGDPQRLDPRELDIVAQIDRVRLDVTAGRIAAATDRADHVVALAEDLGRAGVQSEALLVRAMVRDASARDEDALRDFVEAAALAIEVGRDDLAGESWRRASHVAGFDLEDASRANHWSRLGAAAVRRLGRPPRMLADQLDAEGLLLRLQGDPAAAEASHRAALVQLERVLDSEDPRWIETWLLLAHAQIDQSAADQAVELYERALALARARWGPAHPEHARILLDRALVTRDDPASTEAEIQAAFDDMGTAAEILIACHGERSVRLAPILTIRGELALRLGLLDEATAFANAAWELQRTQLPAHHSERGSALAVLAQVDLASGDWERALESHRLLAKEVGAAASQQELASIDNNIGYLLCRLDRCAEAAEPFRRAIDGGDAFLRASGEAGLGHVASVLGRPDEARAHLQAAFVLTRALDRDIQPLLVAEIEWRLAEVGLQTGERPDDIRPLIARSIEFYTETGIDNFALEELKGLERALNQARVPGRMRRTQPH